MGSGTFHDLERTDFFEVLHDVGLLNSPLTTTNLMFRPPSCLYLRMQHHQFLQAENCLPQSMDDGLRSSRNFKMSMCTKKFLWTLHKYFLGFESFDVNVGSFLFLQISIIRNQQVA